MRAVVRGLGSIGRRHALVLRDLGFDVTGWPVRDHAEPRFAADSGIAVVDGAEGVAAYRGADLVVIATDTSRHAADAVLALDHRASRVLVEKPVAPSAADAAALATHRRAAAVGVAAPLRAHEGFRVLATRLSALPGPRSAHVHCRSWLPDWRPDRDYRESYSARADEGGVLRDLVHEIDYAIALFGPPVLTGAVLRHDGPLPIAAEQAATLMWTAGDTVVLTELDYISRPPSRGVRVQSPYGRVEWDVAAATLTTTEPDGTTTSLTFAADQERNTVMTTQIRAFLDLEDGATPAERIAAGAPATLDEGLRALAVCDRARQFPAARPASLLAEEAADA